MGSWLLLLSLPVLYFLLAHPLLAILEGEPTTPMALIGLLWSIVLLMGFLSWPSYYVLSPRSLRMRRGPRRWRIALSSIVSAEISQAGWKATALSLRRVRITWRRQDGHHQSILISPRDRDAFLDDLRQRCPWLRELSDQEGL